MPTLKTKVTSEMIFDYDPVAEKTSNLRSQYLLEVSNNIQHDRYLDEKGLPNALGCKVVTETLVNALASNIHNAHQKGWKDSAEHLREIIKKLEDRFIDQVEIFEGTM